MSEQQDALVAGPFEERRWEGIGLVRVVAPDDDQSCAWVQRGDGVEQFAVALLGDQSPDRADDHCVVVGCPRPAENPPLLIGEQPWTETLEVDAVAEVAHLAAGGEMPSADHLDVLDVLDELSVGPLRGERFEGVDEQTAQPGIVRRCVEPVGRVDDDGHAGQPANDPSVQPGLGVVRVQDRRSFAAQQAPQLEGGAQIRTQAPAPRRRRQGEVADAAPLDRLHERPRCADADGLATSGDDGVELRSEQQLEAHVHRRQVGDLHDRLGITSRDLGTRSSSRRRHGRCLPAAAPSSPCGRGCAGRGRGWRGPHTRRPAPACRPIVSVLRPLTCAQPVIPGTASNRRA